MIRDPYISELFAFARAQRKVSGQLRKLSRINRHASDAVIEISRDLIAGSFRLIGALREQREAAGWWPRCKPPRRARRRRGAAAVPRPRKKAQDRASAGGEALSYADGRATRS